MTESFSRALRVTIGGTSDEPITSFEDDGLRMAFEIEKTSARTPNYALLSIYNLSPSSRKRLHEKQDFVIIEAGYFEEFTQLFSGTIRTLNSSLNGPDWVTSMNLTDGDRRKERVALSFGPGVKFRDVALATAKATGHKLGNLEDKLKAGTPRKLTSYTKGIVIYGSAADEFNKLMEAAGWEFSIQDDTIQILEPRQSNPTSAKEIPLISPKTGMLGSPDIAESGILTVRMLLAPEITPGDPIDIKSRQFDGRYRVNQIGHSGDTFSDRWQTTIDCQLLNTDKAAGPS